MYRVPNSDLMWIGVSTEEAREVRIRGGGVQDVFLKKFRITEQDVWNMLEPYGILLTIFDKAISTKAVLQDVLGSLKLAMGYEKDDPSILGEVEGIDKVIKMHIKYRLSPEMKDYKDIVRNTMIKNLEEYKISPVMQALQELVRKGQVIADDNPKLLKLYNSINEYMITKIIKDMQSMISSLSRGTADQIAGIEFDEENNLDLFGYLSGSEDIKKLLQLLPGTFVQLKGGKYTYKQEEFNAAVGAIIKGILEEFVDKFSQEAEKLENFFGTINSAIPDLISAAKKHYD